MYKRQLLSSPSLARAQGAFIRRHQIPKDPKEGGGFYTEHDLFVGAEFSVYNKMFRIYDCNDSTRAFLAQDLLLPPAQYMAAPDCPEGEYNTMLRQKMQRETGADLTVKRNRRMHPMKMCVSERSREARAREAAPRARHHGDDAEARAHP